MSKPLLSICIATYNRSDFIGETLDSIVPQLTSEVEVVIVDGASTDNTTEVVAKYLKDSETINYVRLLQKGGVDQDYCKAVDFAKGEMCWLFTDDDLLLPNAVATVLAELKKGYSLIVVNSQLMTTDFSSQISERLIKIDKDKIFSESELGSLFAQVIKYLSYIGAVVINRELWLDREKEQYFGSEFIHVGIIFQSPLPSKAFIIANPQIKIRYGNAQWTKRAFIIGMIKWPQLLNSFNAVNSDIKKGFTFQSPFDILRGMLIFRSKGQFAPTDLNIWAKHNKNLVVNLCLGKIISVIPSIILNLIFLMYLKIFDRRNLIAIHDLERFKDAFFSSKWKFFRRI